MEQKSKSWIKKSNKFAQNWLTVKIYTHENEHFDSNQLKVKHDKYESSHFYSNVSELNNKMQRTREGNNQLCVTLSQ